MVVSILGSGKQQPAAPAPDKALLVTNGVVEDLPVTALTAGAVTTPMGEYPRDQVTELIRSRGGRVFLIHASLPARMEAEQVRALRRNALLHGLFHQRGEPDVGRVPMQVWLVIGGLILAVIILGAV